MQIKTQKEKIMAIQTARVTFLTSPDFKAWLVEEAGKADVSVSEFIRLRCQYGPSEDELMLLAMAEELKKATRRAGDSLEKGIRDAESVLKELRRRKKVTA